MKQELSLCPICNCMTKRHDRVCNKCGEKTIERTDGRIEWICEHNVGHTIKVPKGFEHSPYMWVHGCDGCCKKVKK